MRKYVLLIILVLVGAKYGIDYLLSPKFQTYADNKKIRWTCYINNLLGGFYITISEYKKAEDAYRPVLVRCAKTPLAEDATYRLAMCLEKTSPLEAGEMYKKFLEDFPKSKKAHIAQKALDNLGIK